MKQKKGIGRADEKRHKCLKCGSVRYECFMRKPTKDETTADYYFNNCAKQWICRGHEFDFDI